MMNDEDFKLLGVLIYDGQIDGVKSGFKNIV